MMLNMHPQVKKAMALNDEAFPISQKLPVHPDELVLKEVGKHDAPRIDPRAIVIPEPPSATQKVTRMGESFWQEMERDLPPFKNISLEVAAAIAKQNGFEFKYFYDFENNVRNKIALIDPEQGRNENLDSRFILPSGKKSPIIWVLSFFKNSIPAAVFMHSIGFFCLFKSVFKKSRSSMNKHFAASAAAIGTQQAKEVLNVTAWSYGCLFAMYYDSKHNTDYYNVCLDFMAFESEHAYSELEGICADLYKSNTYIKEMPKGEGSLDDYFKIHDMIVAPMFKEYIQRISGSG
jgi:hypothetical protein